ncbi:MAG: transcription antitermination factor NusB [Bdellovibrionales bacterium]|nr:transcription antitermination factor NusB [Bdellovibrionales bacterium]
MKSRRKARESALQALYQCDTCANWLDETIELYFKQFTEERELSSKSAHEENYLFARKLIFGARDFLLFLDKQITTASTHWNIERMSRVDRNILRLAVYEMAFCDDIPSSVSINEAIEVAKRFGSDDSPTFVNGVLDHVARLFRQHPELIEEEKQAALADELAVVNG